MSKNEIGQDSPIPKFIYLKIRRRDGVESLTILEEGEFKVPIDGCIRLAQWVPVASSTTEWYLIDCHTFYNGRVAQKIIIHMMQDLKILVSDNIHIWGFSITYKHSAS